MSPSEIVLPLFKQGMTVAQVKCAVDGMMTRKQFNSVLKRLRAKGEVAPYPRRRGSMGQHTHCLRLDVSDEVFEALKPHAERRSMSMHMLCARILDSSIECVDAILDDGFEARDA